MKSVASLSSESQCRDAFAFHAKVLGGKISVAIPMATLLRHADEKHACGRYA